MVTQSSGAHYRDRDATIVTQRLGWAYMVHRRRSAFEGYGRLMNNNRNPLQANQIIETSIRCNGSID